MEEERQKRITISNETIASNPGEINFNPFVWFKHKTTTILLLFSTIHLAIVLTVSVSNYFLILAIIAIAINALYWIRSKEHFTADSNAGLVISEQPKLVAVSTDLTKYGGHYPVIKIIEFKVKREIMIGERVGTVATYIGALNDETPYWLDFFPEPIEYATDNQIELQSALETYPEEQWQAIERGLSELVEPYQPGLYRVDIQGSDWESKE